MDPAVVSFWNRFTDATGVDASFSAWAFALEDQTDAYQVALADELARLVLHGPKRATASLLSDFERDGEPMPQIGDYSVILDGRGQPVCVIRTTRLDTTRFGDVDADFAWDEGEGNRTLASWRADHLRFFAHVGSHVTDDTMMLLERFEKVWPAHGTLADGEADDITESILERMAACELDLGGRTIITEAATGPYASTAAAAGAAGADVYAVSSESPYGTAEDAAADVMALASRLRVPERRMTIVADRSDLPVERADIITNSGFLRPIDAALIERLPLGAVIALMYEAWEARATDIDFAAAAARGIDVIGVNEHHPACGAFDFVGDLVVAAAAERSWELANAAVVLISDNAFVGPVSSSLEAVASRVAVVGTNAARPPRADLVVVAATPPSSAAAAGIDPTTPQQIAELVLATEAPRCIQLWGDIDRELIGDRVMFEPIDTPAPGHQGIPMSAAGFEPVVRLQVAGVAAALHRNALAGSHFADFAQRVTAHRPKENG